MDEIENWMEYYRTFADWELLLEDDNEFLGIVQRRALNWIMDERGI